MDWEENVYDLQQEIRERDAESLDNLSDGVLTALENRYEAMLEAEQPVSYTHLANTRCLPKGRRDESFGGMRG